MIVYETVDPLAGCSTKAYSYTGFTVCVVHLNLYPLQVVSADFVNDIVDFKLNPV